MSEHPPAPPDLPAAAELLDRLPVSLIIYRADGVIAAMNRPAEQLWGASRSAVIGQFNILSDPQSVAQGSAQLFARALAGETVRTAPVKYDTAQVQAEIPHPAARVIWIQATIFPLPAADGSPAYVGIVHQDVSEQIAQAEAMEQAQAEIEGQREAILALSSPVVQVWEGILTMPLVGTVDARRAQAVTETLLEAIVTHQADIVILDITGVPVVDTMVASYILSAARAVRLLGSQVVLVGISSEIAQTLTQIGFDGAQLMTLANLRAAISWAFEQLGLRVVAEEERP